MEGFGVGSVFDLNLVSQDVDSFFIILDFEIEPDNLEFEFLVLAMVLFDEIFGGFEGILLEVAF